MNARDDALPDGWQHALDHAITTWGGTWTPQRAQGLLTARYDVTVSHTTALRGLAYCVDVGVLQDHGGVYHADGGELR